MKKPVIIGGLRMSRKEAQQQELMQLIDSIRKKGIATTATEKNAAINILNNFNLDDLKDLLERLKHIDKGKIKNDIGSNIDIFRDNVKERIINITNLNATINDIIQISKLYYEVFNAYPLENLYIQKCTNLLKEVKNDKVITSITFGDRIAFTPKAELYILQPKTISNLYNIISLLEFCINQNENIKSIKSIINKSQVNTMKFVHAYVDSYHDFLSDRCPNFKRTKKKKHVQMRKKLNVFTFMKPLINEGVLTSIENSIFGGLYMNDNKLYTTDKIRLYDYVKHEKKFMSVHENTIEKTTLNMVKVLKPYNFNNKHIIKTSDLNFLSANIELSEINHINNTKYKNYEDIKKRILEVYCRSNGRIGLIYDQFNIKLIEYITDTIPNDLNPVTNKIYNINAICSNWDAAPKPLKNVVNVLIKPIKHIESPVVIEIEKTGIQFKFETDKTKVKNYVDVTGLEKQPNRNEILTEPEKEALLEFHNTELVKKYLDIGVGSLCKAVKDEMNNAFLFNQKLTISKDKIYTKNNKFLQGMKDKINKLFVANFYDNMSYLHIKRSGDYGQVYFTKYMNDTKANFQLQVTSALDSKSKEISLVKRHLESNFISKWVLVTSDHLCYAKARLEEVPCIFHDLSVASIYLYEPKNEPKQEEGIMSEAQRNNANKKLTEENMKMSDRIVNLFNSFFLSRQHLYKAVSINIDGFKACLKKSDFSDFNVKYAADQDTVEQLKVIKKGFDNIKQNVEILMISIFELLGEYRNLLDLQFSNIWNESNNLQESLKDVDQKILNFIYETLTENNYNSLYKYFTENVIVYEEDQEKYIKIYKLVYIYHCLKTLKEWSIHERSTPEIPTLDLKEIEMFNLAGENGIIQGFNTLLIDFLERLDIKFKYFSEIKLNKEIINDIDKEQLQSQPQPQTFISFTDLFLDVPIDNQSLLFIPYVQKVKQIYVTETISKKRKTIREKFQMSMEYIKSLFGIVNNSTSKSNEVEIIKNSFTNQDLLFEVLETVDNEHKSLNYDSETTTFNKYNAVLLLLHLQIRDFNTELDALTQQIQKKTNDISEAIKKISLVMSPESGGALVQDYEKPKRQRIKKQQGGTDLDCLDFYDLVKFFNVNLLNLHMLFSIDENYMNSAISYEDILPFQHMLNEIMSEHGDVSFEMSPSLQNDTALIENMKIRFYTTTEERVVTFTKLDDVVIDGMVEKNKRKHDNSISNAQPRHRNFSSFHNTDSTTQQPVNMQQGYKGDEHESSFTRSSSLSSSSFLSTNSITQQSADMRQLGNMQPEYEEGTQLNGNTSTEPPLTRSSSSISSSSSYMQITGMQEQDPEEKAQQSAGMRQLGNMQPEYEEGTQLNGNTSTEQPLTRSSSSISSSSSYMQITGMQKQDEMQQDPEEAQQSADMQLDYKKGIELNQLNGKSLIQAINYLQGLKSEISVNAENYKKIDVELYNFFIINESLNFLEDYLNNESVNENTQIDGPFINELEGFCNTNKRIITLRIFDFVVKIDNVLKNIQSNKGKTGGSNIFNHSTIQSYYQRYYPKYYNFHSENLKNT